MKMTIKAWRAYKNITQKELADSINVHPSTLSKWENNRSYPTIPQYRKLCKALDIEENQIFFG